MPKLSGYAEHAESNWAIDVNGGVDIGNSDRAIDLTIPQTPLGTLYGTLTSMKSYDLTDCGVVVRLVQSFAPTSTGFVYFSVRNPADASIEFGLVNMKNELKIYKSGVMPSIYRKDFVPGEHVFFRLREAGGRTYWDVSATGETWTNLRDSPDEIPLTDVKVGLGGGTFASSSIVPGSARLDDLDMRP